MTIFKENLVIWDWNGTLLDDVPAAVAAMNTLLNEYNITPTLDLDKYRKLFSFPVKSFYKEIGIDPEQVEWDALAKRYHSLLRSNYQVLNKEAIAALTQFKKAGIKQGIVSALRQDLLNADIDKFGLSDYFDFVNGSDNLDGASKEARFTEMTRAGNFNNKNVISIADTLHDVEIAKEFGFTCFVYTGGHQAEFRFSEADVKTFDSLLKIADFIGVCFCAEGDNYI